MREAVSPQSSTVVLDRPRHLFVDLNALEKAEELTGKNMLDIRSWPNLTAKDWKALIWACLLRQDDEVTLELVGACVHPGNLKYVQDKVYEAVKNSMPEQEEKEDGEEEDPPKPPAL